ncbi:hypothetical protein DPMN_188294 [Dreissena polymorpha]|uniref:Uncharacterized protein n=1 Tax=Dreissena polymorpha TaxID=45954 RepID=A0A9D4DT52_DREPO|nr:hypothetical protein DPMN_188294 [Dreissena polymorpha]
MDIIVNDLCFCSFAPVIWGTPTGIGLVLNDVTFKQPHAKMGLVPYATLSDNEATKPCMMLYTDSDLPDQAA